MARIGSFRRGAVAALLVVLVALRWPGAGAAPITTQRVSVADDESQATGGSSFTPAFSADGRFVAFTSAASNLVAGDTNAASDVFVRDLVAGTTERVSVTSVEGQANALSSSPSISDDGRYVAFHSGATNLAPIDANGAFDVFVRDRQAGTTEHVSVDSNEVQGAGISNSGAISGDGRLVAFHSNAPNLVPGDANGEYDVFVRDLAAGTTERVSVSSGEAEASGGDSAFADLNRDGRFVAFRSDATNLVAGDTNAVLDVFVRDRTDGTTERVNLTSDGAQATGNISDQPAISGDGRVVVFHSSATNLVAGDTNAATDVFRKDRRTGALTRVSVRSDGAQGNGNSSVPDVSADGRFVAYESFAANLVSTGTDTMGFPDVFVHDGLTGDTVRVSEGSEGDGASTQAAVAAWVPTAGFASVAANLVSGDTNADFDVFTRQYRQATGALVLDNLGGIFTFGSGAVFQGSVPALRAAGTPVGNAAIVDLEATPTGNGYYVLDDAGGIFTFGDAAFVGSVPGLRAAGACTCAAPIIDMAVTPSGQGYLALDDQGGIFAFGDAVFFGSIPALRASGVAVGSAMGVDLAVTPTGQGYLILDATGGIFTFGDGAFFGSLPGLRAGGANIGSAPSIRLATSPTGRGYLVLDSVGGMFTFGDAQFFGSVPSLRQAGVAIGDAQGVDLAPTPTGLGYVILDSVGGMFTFGDAEFFGSIPQLRNQGVPIGPNTSIRVDLVSSMTGG